MVDRIVNILGNDQSLSTLIGSAVGVAVGILIGSGIEWLNGIKKREKNVTMAYCELDDISKELSKWIGGLYRVYKALDVGRPDPSEVVVQESWPPKVNESYVFSTFKEAYPYLTRDQRKAIKVVISQIEKYNEFIAELHGVKDVNSLMARNTKHNVFKALKQCYFLIHKCKALSVHKREFTYELYPRTGKLSELFNKYYPI